jgi:hypothetical protein
MRRTATRTSAALALLCAFAASTASAGQSQYPTFFDKFKYEASSSGNDKFSGKIDSSKGNCVKGRKVVLYRRKSGDKKKLGSDKTNNKGKFSIGLGDGPPKNGKYFAEAKKSSFENGKGDKITCGGADSAKVTLS